AGGRQGSRPRRLGRRRAGRARLPHGLQPAPRPHPARAGQGAFPLQRRYRVTITLRPGAVSLADLAAIYWNGEPATLDRGFDAAIGRGAARVAAVAAGNEPVYGINTGFGKLASIKI